jgi:hypothetical protein
VFGETCGITEGEAEAPGYADDWPVEFGANWLVCVLVVCGVGEACPGPISPGNDWMPKSEACGSVDGARSGAECPCVEFPRPTELGPDVPMFEGEITASEGGWLAAGPEAGLFSSGKGTGVPNVNPFCCRELLWPSGGG